MSNATTLKLEGLEARECPAVVFQIDYSFDTNGFFNDPGRRAVLQSAADAIGAHLDANLPALVPGGGNTWAARFFNPATGGEVQIPNLAVGANTIVIYAGGRNLEGAEAGEGGYGGYSAGGSQAWFDSIRGRAGFGLWGGALSFDTVGTNWYFGGGISGIGANQLDFYSTAVHELTHVLGIGTSPQWNSLTAGGAFVGPTATAVLGGPVPLSADGDHWAEGITVRGDVVSMDPYASLGRRVELSALDFAGLKDLGWTVSDVAGVPGAASSFTPPVSVGGGGTPVVLTGATDGTAQIYTLNSDDTLVAAGAPSTPFGGWTGVIRSVVGDFNGDGTKDYAFATGAGTAGTVRVYDGKTGADLVGRTTVLDGFAGGLFLAAGDVDRDGRDELALSADAGGGTRVVLFRVYGGRLTVAADFLAFGDASFRGGSRVAMADVNRDGAADLVVGAGLGGGPRVAVYDGAALAAGKADRLVPDFFALDSSLRSGVYVAAADVDGDGSADVIYSTGNTGGPRVRIVSGAVLVANPGADMAALPALADFFTWDQNDRAGIRVAAKDVDGDGRAELIVGSGNTNSAMVRVIPFSEMNTPTTKLTNPFGNPATIDGVYVG
ncbi:VCBS repeat-containing protein [Urbifossiella limnaea]|uniref:FG-GAP repeat protein n=1 Tax=Urbifossiella limnaea TaxID=2528023 RepID=A0A517XMW9_9BACT|nr:VCBS repeat-containing protein [Urbifossiella limnaea]QDU18854.1 FG-GAP repeat protein [Urbifossiella limnaea]